jgi:hypothetical protein
VFRGSKTPTELRRHYLDEYMGQFGHVMPKEMLVPAATPNADGTPSYTQVVPVRDEIRVWDKAHPRFGDAVDSAFIARRRYAAQHTPYLMQCFFVWYALLRATHKTCCDQYCQQRGRMQVAISPYDTDLCAAVTCNMCLYHTAWPTFSIEV